MATLAKATLSLDDVRHRAMLSIQETARVLGMDEGTAYRAARDGQIPTLPLGRRHVVPVPALLRWLGETPSADDEAPQSE